MFGPGVRLISKPILPWMIYLRKCIIYRRCSDSGTFADVNEARRVVYNTMTDSIKEII